MRDSILFWRRADGAGLERLELAVGRDEVTATGTVLCLEGGGFRLDHLWRLDAQWRAQSVVVECRHSQGHEMLRVERAGSGWLVDGALRTDLDGAEEPDLSVTPFCNSLAIRRTPDRAGASLTIDTAFIHAPALTVARSRQRYVRHGLRQLRFIDLGLSKGFEAELVVDDSGLVICYEHLFERVTPAEAPG